MVKHTPGPWIIEDDTDIIDQNGTFIATTHDPASDIGTAREYANARLIAAAPDLLAALKASQEMVERSAEVYADRLATDGTSHAAENWGAALKITKQVQAAIAKAEGDQ